jgi:hypothetical protein
MVTVQSMYTSRTIPVTATAPITAGRMRGMFSQKQTSSGWGAQPGSTGASSCAG